MTAAAFGADRRVVVNSWKFAAAHLFASRDRMRFYLRGVLVEPHKDGGVIMAATDGHRLLVIRDQEGSASATFICTAPAAILKACVQKPRSIRFGRDFAQAKHLHFIGHTAYVTSKQFTDSADAIRDVREIGPMHLAVAHAPAIDGDFPDWRRVIPSSVPAPSPNCWCDFNPALIEGFAQAATLLMKGAGLAGGACLKFGIIGADCPVLVNIGGLPAPDAFGLLMPLRSLDAPKGVPAWVASGKQETME